MGLTNALFFYSLFFLTNTHGIYCPRWHMLKAATKYIWNTQQQHLFPEIMTPLLKMIQDLVLSSYMLGKEEGSMHTHGWEGWQIQLTMLANVTAQPRKTSFIFTSNPDTSISLLSMSLRKGKTEQLTKQSRYLNSTTSKRNNMYFWNSADDLWGHELSGIFGLTIVVTWFI